MRGAGGNHQPRERLCEDSHFKRQRGIRAGKGISTPSQANAPVQPPVRSAPQPADAADADSQTASAGQTKMQSASNTAATSTKRSAVKAGSSKGVSVPNTPAVAPAPVAATASNLEPADNLPSAPPALSGSIHVADRK